MLKFETSVLGDFSFLLLYSLLRPSLLPEARQKTSIRLLCHLQVAQKRSLLDLINSLVQFSFWCVVSRT